MNGFVFMDGALTNCSSQALGSWEVGNLDAFDELDEDGILSSAHL